MAPGTVRPCVHCGNKFVPMNSKDSKFCSMACFTTWRRAKTVKKKCEGCGSEFELWQREAENRRYCSHSCFMSSQKIYEGQAKCSGCGVCFTPIRWRNSARGFSYTVRRKDTFVCSLECLNQVRVSAIRHSAELRAKNNPESQSRKKRCSPTNSSYRGAEWAAISESIRARDKYRCQRCGVSQQDQFAKYKRRLSVHHIIPFHNFPNARKANRRKNLITLCDGCHRSVEKSIPEVQLTFCFSNSKADNRPGYASGSRHWNARFSEKDVIDIRRRYRNGENIMDLSNEYQVVRSTIANVITGKTWHLVPNPGKLRTEDTKPGRKRAI